MDLLKTVRKNDISRQVQIALKRYVLSIISLILLRSVPLFFFLLVKLQALRTLFFPTIVEPITNGEQDVFVKHEWPRNGHFLRNVTFIFDLDLCR